MSGGTSSLNSSGFSPVPVICEAMDLKIKGKEHMLEIIDGIEKQVEIIRTQAAFLEEEKDDIVTVLDTMKNSVYVDSLREDEKEEVLYSLERLGTRLGSVEVAVRVTRDSTQEEALSEVNDLIARMVVDIERDTFQAKVQCHRFLNTCVSDPEAGPIDKVFENALLGCTLDDQKRIRKRLRGLMDYLEHLVVTQL